MDSYANLWHKFGHFSLFSLILDRYIKGYE